MFGVREVVKVILGVAVLRSNGCLNDLPFHKTLHLKNPLNKYKPVKISRHCQELSADIGLALCELLDCKNDVDGLLTSPMKNSWRSIADAGNSYASVQYARQILHYFHVFYQGRNLSQDAITSPSKFLQATKPSWKQLESLGSNSHDDDRNIEMTDRDRKNSHGRIHQPSLP